MGKHIKIMSLLIFLTVMTGCSPHFHLDFLGQDQITEVVVIQNASKEKVLMVDISGIITSVSNPNILNREKNILSSIRYRLEMAAEDRHIRGIILRIDTPGGEVTASDIIYNEIRLFKQKTGVPVVALGMGVMASGGYYIASASDYIIAHPTAITGSIGVISIFPNIQELFDKLGIQVNIIKSGRMKDSGSSFREMTAEEEAVFQSVVDELYQKFLTVVLEGRKELLSREELKKIADGRIYTAGQAHELKLIDEIGYFDRAFEKTKQLAGIKNAQLVTYTYYPKSKTNIYASASDSPSLSNDDAGDIRKIFPSLQAGFYYLWLPQNQR
jgi:protease-4